MLFRESHYNLPTLAKYCETLTGNVNNMPKINAYTDVCILKSVNFLQRCPKVTVREAMIMGGFSEEEQQDRVKQAWIYRRWKKNPTGTTNTAPPPLFNVQINTAVVDEEGPLSSVTSATLSDESKKAKRVRMTGSAAQSMRTARLHEKKKYNHAFKRATIVYAREKQKKGGFLARGVTELVKNKYNVDVCPQTVQVYVKKGNIGMSPQRHGPKSKIDDCHYKNLCLAFESFVAIQNINDNPRKRTYKILGKLLQEVVYGVEGDDKRMTVPNSIARQQALANGRGHGGRFLVTGGMHSTSEDMFIAMEMEACQRNNEGAEKDKKRRLQLQAVEEKGTAIVVQGKSIDLLPVAKLDVLLAWYQATKSKGAKKANKAEQWKQILESRKQPPDCDRWTAEDEERIVGLAVQGNNINISDTQYGRKVALKKRELEAAADCMTREERKA